jgi:hypothetical protein
MSIETTASETADQTIRLPKNVLRLIRQSYSSRERVLDWTLAIFVAAAMCYVFKAQLMGMFAGDPSINAGATPSQVPNQNVGDAFPTTQYATPNIYTYNMPVSRNLERRFGPILTRVPHDPSLPLEYPDDGC